jgi:DNA polymerase-3 subunit chi
MKIQFYHLLHTPLDKALPSLLHKTLGAGFKSVVIAESDARMRELDEAMWESEAFIPHGIKDDEFPQMQPVYVTDVAENPNEAKLLVVTAGQKLESLEGCGEVERVVDMFNGRDEAALNAARQRWKIYKEAGYSLTYIQQQPGGGWKEMAKAN